MDGVEATRRLAVAVPETAVIVLTMFDDDETVFAAMRAGARGYLLKGAGQSDILTTLRAVVSGQMVIGPAVAERLMQHLTSPPRHAEPFPELTAREREVLDGIARGLDNTQIAAHLHLAEKTVRNHITAICDKIAVETRSQAIVLARTAGLGGS